MILPLLWSAADGGWQTERWLAPTPVLVPLLSVGRTGGGWWRAIGERGQRRSHRQFHHHSTAADQAAGGPPLCATHLSEDLFAAAAMWAVSKDLMAMKLAELKVQGGAGGAG